MNKDYCIYIIHLSEQSDRKINVEKQIKKNPDIQIFEAINASKYTKK